MTALRKFTCRWCGVTFAKDRTDGRFDARSSSIAHIDKEGRFCTLRCAARYGVSAARQVELNPPRRKP